MAPQYSGARGGAPSYGSAGTTRGGGYERSAHPPARRGPTTSNGEAPSGKAKGFSGGKGASSGKGPSNGKGASGGYGRPTPPRGAPPTRASAPNYGRAFPPRGGVPSRSAGPSGRVPARTPPVGASARAGVIGGGYRRSAPWRAPPTPAAGGSQKRARSEDGEVGSEEPVEEAVAEAGEEVDEEVDEAAVVEDEYEFADMAEEDVEAPPGEEREVADEEAIEAEAEGFEAEADAEELEPNANEVEDAGPERDGDLDLNDIPEHMRESVEGNNELTRVLSKDASTASRVSSAPPAKRPRMSFDAPDEQKRDALLARWGLAGDAAARYVIMAAGQEEVDSVSASSWRPRFEKGRKPGDKGMKSMAEQLNEQLLRSREEKGPPRHEYDAVLAFSHARQLSSEDTALLSELLHKDLRYVMEHFDGRPVPELVEEAAAEVAIEPASTTAEAAPDKPGAYCLGRQMRLELIEPAADALVCGDANLSFALLLAQHRKALGHVGRTVATTFETIDTLRERYTEIDDTVKELEGLDAEVLHNVDGTRLAVDPRFCGMEKKFGAVYYNFPHAGVVQGFFDGHPFVRWRHANLMSLFFRALMNFVKPGGIVKVSSNSNATGVRYSDILQAAEASEFMHVETVPFLEWVLRNYGRSYGDRRDSNRRPGDGDGYRAQKACSDMLYCFKYTPSGNAPPKLQVRRPPSKQTLLDANEGKIGEMSGASKERRVDEIYQLFLSYVKGIHIG